MKYREAQHGLQKQVECLLTAKSSRVGTFKRAMLASLLKIRHYSLRGNNLR